VGCQPMSAAVHRSLNKLLRSNSIFNLWYQQTSISLSTILLCIFVPIYSSFIFLHLIFSSSGSISFSPSMFFLISSLSIPSPHFLSIYSTSHPPLFLPLLNSPFSPLFSLLSTPYRFPPFFISPQLPLSPTILFHPQLSSFLLSQLPKLYFFSPPSLSPQHRSHPLLSATPPSISSTPLSPQLSPLSPQLLPLSPQLSPLPPQLYPLPPQLPLYLLNCPLCLLNRTLYLLNSPSISSTVPSISSTPPLSPQLSPLPPQPYPLSPQLPLYLLNCPLLWMRFSL
jgi:hypothetical protein